MKVITSRDNDIYKRAHRLLRRKYRDETGLYLVEGVKPVLDALETGIDIERVFIAEGIGMITDRIDRSKITGLSKPLFKALSDTETSQGVIAIAKRRIYDENSFIEETADSNLILLDRLQDPGNVGTIIRTAEAAGIKGILALKGTVDIYSPKVVRAASGSLFRIPVITGLSEDEGVGLARSAGLKIAVTSAEDGEDCFDFLPKGNSILVIGNEGSGVSDSLAREADIRLKIPMEGRIESLNAAVAAGILMYQMR